MTRFLILFAVLLLAVFFLSGLFRGLRGVSQRREEGRGNVVEGGDMVRDPVCGVYVAKRTALARHYGGETHYFCGETCAKKFEIEPGQS
ncbi:MAG: YHS domain-containing protein [Nitrospirota bacterium]